MAFDNLRIIRLQAENVKRLVAVDISPKGDVVTIAGKNGHGKTSTLDSILWAMAGGRAIQWKPIREGEAQASIRLELGNADGLQLIVTRTFKAKEDGETTTKLTVTTADGMKPKGEQNFLSAMVGALSFDPAAFTRADAKEQVRILKDLIRASDPDADFESIDKRRQEAFDARTEAGKDERRARALAGDVEGEMEKEVDTSDLVSLIADAGRLSQERARIEAGHEREERDLASKRNMIGVIEQTIADLEADLAEQRGRLADEKLSVETMEAAIAARPALEPLPDIAETQAAYQAADRRNLEIRERNNRRAHLSEADMAREEVERLTGVIEACDREVREMIEDAHLPVSGLELTPERVMLRGVPFDQASDAEQLRASMALGMAANPKLRVLRIRDGSLLDDDALAVIREVAGDMNFQIWLEKVGDGGPEAFILENGMLRS